MSKRYTFEQFASTRTYSGLVKYSPDGKEILHVVNTTGQFNLWKIPSGGGMPVQLTAFEDNTVRDMRWSPDGSQIVFQADQNGDEQHQIYVIDANGGWAEPITQKMDSQHNLGTWSKDGKFLIYAANDVNPMHMDVIQRNMETGELTRITENMLAFPAMASSDGKYLLIVKIYGNTNQDILLYNFETGETTNCTPHEGEIIFFPAAWQPDSSGFYIVTNDGREFSNVAFYDLATGTREWVITPDWDVDALEIAKDGSKMVWVQNENGASKLYGRDLKTGEDLKLPELSLGVINTLTLSPDGSKAAMVFVRPGEAANLFEFDLSSGEMIRLGQSMLGGVDPDDLTEPELIHFPTFDGRDIPAWLYKPKGYVEGMRYPVILSIHGGPESQERPMYNYNGLYQYLTSRGFGILAPNIRGSTGYGISYQKLIHRDWGGAELKDIDHAAKYLQSLEWVDSNRLAVYGGSFGGFATLSAVTRLPQYWAAAVDLVGPANLVTFVNSVPPFWKSMMKEWLGDAEEDYDFLMERSPITYVDNIRAPMLVIQGAKDPRVVQAESDQMVERIRANGGDVTYYVDEEEGHGTTRRKNSIKWMKMISDYLVERLLDEPV